jgi:hypothetical protein
MKPATSRRHLVCQHCGLESTASTEHGSARECIVALEHEAQRLRERLRHGRFSVMGPPKTPPDPSNGVASAPRLIQVR